MPLCHLSCTCAWWSVYDFLFLKLGLLQVRVLPKARKNSMCFQMFCFSLLLCRGVMQYRFNEVNFTPGLTPLVCSGFTLVTHVAHLFPLHSSAICPSYHHTAWVDKDSWGSQVFLCRYPPYFCLFYKARHSLRRSFYEGFCPTLAVCFSARLRFLAVCIIYYTSPIKCIELSLWSSSIKIPRSNIYELEENSLWHLFAVCTWKASAEEAPPGIHPFLARKFRAEQSS